MRQGSKSLLGGNGAAGYLAISVAAATALMLAGGARCWGWGQGGETWETYTPITDPSITSPTVSNNGIGINGEVGFTCSTCTDQDKHTVGGQTSYPWDTVTYTWSATVGTFPYGNTGRSVTWKAPGSPGTCTVKVTVNDLDGHPPPGSGSDDDDLKEASLTMEVIRLEKIRLYFSHGSSSPDDAYPYKDNDQFRTRAVVWATCTSYLAYCDVGFDETLTWWKTGLEGPGSDNDEPPAPETFTGTVEDNWPDNWPVLTIEWKRLEHKCSSPSDHSRKYWYVVNGYLANSWGENNRTYSDAGVGLHRLRATVKMHAGTAWEQSKISTDLNGDGVSDGNEWCLRICPKDPTIYVEPDPPPDNSAQRQHYLEWMSTYLDEPYEWGGEGYGGEDSGADEESASYVGGEGSYDGYGMDCSGLVSCAAYRAGYNWSPWRLSCTGLVGVSTAVPTPWMDNLVPGDIINKVKHHVMSYRYTAGTAPNRTFYTIEATGDTVYRRVVQRTRTESYLNTACTEHTPPHYYQGRVLVKSE